MNDLVENCSSKNEIEPWLHGIEQDVDDLDAGDVAAEAVAEFQRSERSSWRAAFLLLRIRGEQLYLAEARKFSDWTKATFGANRQNRVSKMIQAAEGFRELVDQQRPEDREEVAAAAKATPPLTFYEAGLRKLAKTDPKEAARLAASGKTQSQLRQAVNARLPDDHHAPKDRYRTFSIRCTEGDLLKFRAITNGIRLQMDSAKPSDADIVERMFADVIDYDGFVAHLEPLVGRFPLRDIIAGRIQCIECGATSGNDLEGHHSIPKSVKGQDEHGRYRGADAPQVWLCSACHQAVTENLAGTWRVWVEAWRNRKDLDWYRDLLDQWLGPRKLEDIGA